MEIAFIDLANKSIGHQFASIPNYAADLCLQVPYVFDKAPERLLSFKNLIVSASSRLAAIYFQQVVCLFCAEQLINREDVSNFVGAY